MMKRELILIGLIVTMLFSCEENNPTGICGQGNNLCFEIDGSSQTFDARWNTDSLGYKVFATNIYLADTHYVEVKLYNQPVVQSTQFNLFLGQGSGKVIYKVNSEELFVSTGHINIENVYDGRITGSFDALMIDSIYPYELTNGHLDAIIHQ